MATEESCVRIRRKTIVGVATLVVTNLCGNTALGVGMQQTGPLNGIAAVWNMVSNPWVIAGVLILFVWMISQALVLSWADLSFILPMTAVSYILTVIAGRYYLNESVSGFRWGAVLLITAGVALVAPTRPRTTGPSS